MQPTSSGRPKVYEHSTGMSYIWILLGVAWESRARRYGAIRPRISTWAWGLGCAQGEAGRLAPSKLTLVEARGKYGRGPGGGLLLSVL